MSQDNWRNRVRREDELLQQLRSQAAQAASRRAAALRDGVADLGSIEAVAKEIGVSRPAVSKALSKHRPAATGPATTT